MKYIKRVGKNYIITSGLTDETTFNTLEEAREYLGETKYAKPVVDINGMYDKEVIYDINMQISILNQLKYSSTRVCNQMLWNAMKVNKRFKGIPIDELKKLWYDECNKISNEERNI